MGNLTSGLITPLLSHARGRVTASGTLCVSQPEGGKKHPSQPTVTLGTLGAADPAT